MAKQESALKGTRGVGWEAAASDSHQGRAWAGVLWQRPARSAWGIGRRHFSWGPGSLWTMGKFSFLNYFKWRVVGKKIQKELSPGTLTVLSQRVPWGIAQRLCSVVKAIRQPLGCFSKPGVMSQKGERPVGMLCLFSHTFPSSLLTAVSPLSVMKEAGELYQGFGRCQQKAE